MAQRTVARGAAFLGLVPSRIRLPVVERLADGSFLSWLYPGTDSRRRGPVRLLVRVVEYTLTDPARSGAGKRHRLITSLLDPQTADSLALVCCYHERWENELLFDEVDTHQRQARQPLRSQKPVGVIQEIYGLLLAHFLVRTLLLEAATSVQLDPDQLSFSQAVRIVVAAFPDFQLIDPTDHPWRYAQLLADLARCRLPKRDNRINPRVVKRKMSKFPLKRAQHRHPPQPTTPFPLSIALLI